MIRGILTAIFICAILSLQAQEVRVDETFRKTPLSKALKTIQKKYNVKIGYDPAFVQNIIVSYDLKGLSIPQSIGLLLSGTSLTFSPVGENYVIIPAPAEKKIPVERTTLNISGSVVDDDNGETLPQATIHVIGTNIATASNMDGYFSLLSVPGDTCTLEVMYLGYRTQTIHASDFKNPGNVIIRMKSDVRMLNEVVVLGEYNHAVHVEDLPGAFVFNPASVSSLPSLGEQDMSRTLQLLPGVTATDESASGMVIRGSHPTYNLTLLDGMTIYQQDHFIGAFSIINSDVIKDVHVCKGIFDASYGGRTSGVVDITTKNGNAVRPSFNVKMNMMNVKASAELPLGKKWSFFVAGRRSYTDIIQSRLFTTLFDIASISDDQINILAFDGLRNSVTPEYYFFDTNAKLTFRPTTKDVMSLSAYTARDKMFVGDSFSIKDESGYFSDRREEKTQWGNNGISLRWGRQWNDRYYSNVRISSSDFFRQIALTRHLTVDSASSSFWINMRNTIGDVSYAADNEWKLHNNLSMNFGVSGTRQRYTAKSGYDYVLTEDIPIEESPEETNIDEQKQSWLHSLYGSASFSPLKKLTSNAGIRVAYYHTNNSKVYFEPRLSAVYRLQNDLIIKAGYGRNNQFITQHYHHSQAGSVSGLNENYWTLSDPGDMRSPVIASDHVSGGATFRSKRFVYDAELFFKQTRGVIIDENFNSGTADAYGIDVMIQKTSGIHTGWIAYSIGQVMQRHPYVFNGKSFASFQDQRHELKIVDMLTLGNWNLSATTIFGSGKPFQSYTVKYQRDQNGFIDGHVTTPDYSTNSRLPSYFRIDVAVSHKLIFSTFRLETGLSIHNITDHKNIKARRLNTSLLNEAISTNTEIPATYTDIVLMGMSPSLFVSLSF